MIAVKLFISSDAECCCCWWHYCCCCLNK